MRRIWLVVLLLFLGAIVNVAVAWTASVWAPLDKNGATQVATEEQLAWLLRSEWSRPEDVVFANSLHRGVGVVYLVTDREPGFGTLGRSYYGSTCLAGFPLTAIGGALVNQDAIKYPHTFGRKLVGIDSTTHLPFLQNPVTVHAWVPRVMERRVHRNGRFMPLCPIWPGFAINTLFYAVVVWLLFAGPFLVRRWRRMRRGLCPKCAYDLRGSVGETCPECGAAVPSRPMETP